MFDLFFLQLSTINDDLIVDRQGCGFWWVVICNQEKVKDLIMLLSNNLVINHSACRWVNHRSIYSFEEAGRRFLVDKNEEQSWLITWLERLNCLNKLPIWSFEPQTMLLHGRISNSVPINDYLLRNLTIVFHMEVFESFNDKLLELIGSILAEP